MSIVLSHTYGVGDQFGSGKVAGSHSDWNAFEHLFFIKTEAFRHIFKCVKLGVFCLSFGSRCHSAAWLNGQTGPIIDTMEPYIHMFGCFSPNDQNTYAAAVTHEAGLT